MADENMGMAPPKEGLSKGAIIAIVAIGVVVFLGAGYAIGKYSANKTSEEAVTTETPPVPDEPTTTTTTTSATATTSTTDSRTLLTLEYIKSIQGNSRCDEKFLTLPATEKTSFTDPNEEISFSIPYNPKWGNEKYRLPQYVIDSSGEKKEIGFGNIQLGEGCGWFRGIYMTYVDAKNADTVIEEIKKDPDLNSEPEKISINGFEAVKYDSKGICDHHIGIEILGKKHNYAFYHPCSAEADYTELEEVVNSAKIL